MNAEQLFARIEAKRSFLCVGLDTDMNKIPRHLWAGDDPVFAFNRAIVDATAPYAVCYKPNLAFYEDNGEKGWVSFRRTVEYIRERYPDIFIIADAKRGDIGNTSKMYARAFFSGNLVDAVTLSPYMGYDTVEPFLQFDGKWAVILALTSNPSAADFEMQRLEEGGFLYEKVIDTSKEWGTADNIMYVVGATQARMLKGIREHSQVWMSHGDTITALPDDFEVIASTDKVAIAAYQSKTDKLWGVQFHPEYNSTVVNPNPLFVSFVKAAVENKK